MPEVVDTPQRYVLHLMGCNDLVSSDDFVRPRVTSKFLGADRSHANVWLIHRIHIRAIPYHSLGTPSSQFSQFEVTPPAAILLYGCQTHSSHVA